MTGWKKSVKGDIIGYSKQWAGVRGTLSSSIELVEREKLETYPISSKPIEVDLTQLQTRIRALEQAETRLKQELEVSQKELIQCWAFIEKANDIIYKTNANGYFTYANPASERITGYTIEELVGRHYLELIRPDFRDEAARTYGKQFVYKISDTYFEFPLVAKGGREVWVGQHVQLLTREDQVVGFQAIARDITARKAAEESLKSSEERLKYLSTELLATQERERREIAKDLHDSIGSSLAAIKYKIESALPIEKEDKALFALLNPLVTWVQDAIKEVRRICQNLRPAVLDDLGLVVTLSWFCREFESTYPVSVQIQTDIKENDVPEPLKIVIFRIMQEAMNNSAKYSRADLIILRLIKKDETIELDIEDNGQGFDLDEVASRMGSQKGLGLISMKERTEVSGGTFSLRSTIGSGTSIKAIWPV